MLFSQTFGMSYQHSDAVSLTEIYCFSHRHLEYHVSCDAVNLTEIYRFSNRHLESHVSCDAVNLTEIYCFSHRHLDSASGENVAVNADEPTFKKARFSRTALNAAYAAPFFVSLCMNVNACFLSQWGCANFYSHRGATCRGAIV